MNSRVENEPPGNSLKARAIRLLARREYSRAELRERLLRRSDVDGVALDALLDELIADGYLSDARYAQGIVRRRGGDYSRAAIGGALKASGVDAETVTEALAATAADDGEALRALWLRRFGKPPADEREKARQVRFLQRRGFALSAILKLMRERPDSETG